MNNVDTKELEIKILRARIVLLEKIAENYRSICSQVSYRPQYFTDALKAVRVQIGDVDSTEFGKIERLLSDLSDESKWRNLDARLGASQDEIKKNQEFLRLIS
jgi:hypothetical protein